jgi:hypothetical protein
MADIRNTSAFKAVAAQVTADLLTRGLDVEDVTVVNILAAKVEGVAAHAGMTPRTALTYCDPAVIAGHIADFAAGSHDGNSAIRPVRTDNRSVQVRRRLIGRPMMALAQTVKYASSNGSEPVVAHAADLLTELGGSVGGKHDGRDGGDRIEIPVGVLTEAADLIRLAADRIKAGDWSSCPCGDEHGQRELDVRVAPALVADAEVALGLASFV